MIKISDALGSLDFLPCSNNNGCSTILSITATMKISLQQSIALLFLICLAVPVAASIHLPLTRRGGRFVGNSPANLTHLAAILAEVEARYAQTYRAPDENHLVRRWSTTVGAVDDEHLLQATGRDGAW